MVSTEGDRMYTFIRLLSHRGGLLETVWFQRPWGPSTIISPVQLSFRGPEISNVSSVFHTVLAKFSISPSDERALRYCVCTGETDPAVVDEVPLRGVNYFG